MSKTRTKEELIRLAWIAALRRSGHRKCVRVYSAGAGRVCALGLLAEVAGIAPAGLEDWEVGALAGLCEEESQRVARLNDGVDVDAINIRPHTFREIADVVEGW